MYVPQLPINETNQRNTNNPPKNQQDQMVAGMHNMSLLGTYGTDMHQDLVWLRGKFPKWMPRCVLRG